MIRHASRMLFILLIAALAACSSGAGGAARPGDRAGDMLLTRGGADNTTFLWQVEDCQESGDNATCQVPAGTKLNLSYGIYAERGMDLETLWAEHTYEMTVNGTPVDLKSFGWIDTYHPTVGKMRFWDVTVTPAGSAQLVVRSKGVIGGEPFDSTMTYVFAAP